MRLNDWNTKPRPCRRRRARSVSVSTVRSVPSTHTTACVGRLEPADQPQQRRFAGAAAAHDGDELPALDGQAGAVQHGLLPIALADVVELDPCRCDGVHEIDPTTDRRVGRRRVVMSSAYSSFLSRRPT